MKKYVTVLCDGMADYPDENGKTPMMLANKPTMDALIGNALFGLVQTVPDGMKPGSDVCNLAALGYSPEACYTGRSPLEALSQGVVPADGDVTYRMNFVTLSEESELSDRTMLDYSAGEISTQEAVQLVESLKREFAALELFPGISYRHTALMHDGKTGTQFTPPHDLTGKPIKNELPRGVYGDIFTELIKKSIGALSKHPVNIERKKLGKNPANAVWFWGEGTKPAIENFAQKFGKRGAVISAVDLVKGIGIAGGMTVVNIPTATGTVDTDYEAKLNAALSALNTHDYCFIHFEGPDECGHQGDRAGKIASIERIDSRVMRPLVQALSGGDFAIAVMPDHATPLSVRTHTTDPVPFFVYDSHNKRRGAKTFDENSAANGIRIDKGSDVINIMFGNLNA